MGEGAGGRRDGQGYGGKDDIRRIYSIMYTKKNIYTQKCSTGSNSTSNPKRGRMKEDLGCVI